jgi:hypothetical protein
MNCPMKKKKINVIHDDWTGPEFFQSVDIFGSH